MYFAGDLAGVFIGVASEAEPVGRCGNQLDVSDVFIGSNFMATGATRSDRRVNHLAGGLIRVTLRADRSIRFGIEWDRVSCRQCGGAKPQEGDKPKPLAEDWGPGRIQPVIQDTLRKAHMHGADLSGRTA